MKKKLLAGIALVAVLMIPVSAQAGGGHGRWHRSHHHHSDEALAIGILGGILGGIVLDRVILSAPPPSRSYDPYDAGYGEGYDRGYRRGQSERYRSGAARGYEEGYDAGRFGNGL
jgi:hypothetical protein